MKKYFVVFVLTLISVCSICAEPCINLQFQFAGEGFSPRYNTPVDVKTEDPAFSKYSLQFEYLNVKDSGFTYGARTDLDYVVFEKKLKYGKEVMTAFMDGWGIELAPAFGWTFRTKLTTTVQLFSYPLMFSTRYIKNIHSDSTALQDGTPVITFRHKSWRNCFKTGFGASVQWGPKGWKHGIVGGLNFVIADNYFEKGMHFDPDLELSIGYKMSIGL